MIYKELSFSDFYDEFSRSGRINSWSYDSLIALYDYIENIGSDYELDVIELDCAYRWVNIDDAKWDCMHGYIDADTLNEMTWEECIEWLEPRTTVIPCGFEQAVILEF
jgi:hypothetical protein